jgi:hypothetical protein
MKRLLPILLALAALLPAAAAPSSAEPDHITFLPLVSQLPATPYRLGVDMRAHADDAALPYASALAPRWMRAGDLLWSQVEVTRGVYDWSAAAALEANIARIRAAGAEPLVNIQWTPTWAQRIPGRVCGPPAPAYVPDLARFMAAAAQRYASGPLQVRYWQFGNEVDFHPDQVPDTLGSGCWATRAAPSYGGDYYGQVLSQVAAAIRSVIPDAYVLAGGVAHFWPEETQTIGFVRGMLASATPGAFDALSFSAYGMYRSADRVVYKANSLRRELAAAGMGGKGLFAAEVGAVCLSNTLCPANYRQYQADYASRIYAEVLALDLAGALWYTMADADPGFQHSHLVSGSGAALTPWPAYYALRNSARLLRAVRGSLGPPAELDDSQAEMVQTLSFGIVGGTLHALWVPRTGVSRPYVLAVPPGARARCTTALEQPAPTVADCSDGDGDGRIALTVGSGATYVEVVVR